MQKKIIRSHAARVKDAKKLLESPRYSGLYISQFDREAFVEFFLLEDILDLYQIRLKDEKAYVPRGRADAKGREINIKKFEAIIKVLDAAIGAARSAINAGNYKMVWKAIHEGPMMLAANRIKYLPELRKMAIEILKQLLDEMDEAEVMAQGIDEDLDDLEAHEENVRRVKGLPSFNMEEIEEVIRIAEAVIPDRKSNKKTNLDS